MRPYISLDIETTGLDKKKCQVLEVAAVYDDLVSPISELPTQSWWVDWPLLKGEPTAFAMHAASGLLQEYAVARRLDSEHVMPGLFEFVNKCGLDPTRLQLAGKNVLSFDWPFLERLPYGNIIKPRHRAYDPGQMFFVPSDDSPPDLKECLRRAKAPDIVIQHRALSDALDVVFCVRTWMKGNDENP